MPRFARPRTPVLFLIGLALMLLAGLVRCAGGW